ncbi:3-dehydroquinate synthase [Effusibacillus lacus]|uniref:3-dehydroquinate synthase n=1 Tax=Effusibacillus lacus TaxID=1348429 RepID=A0A292YIJ7_9BACL|nr:3-dehydroquinate synthase [Effusibacillus lacus]TCS75302.1 3-dehydroquinate synthase [Effusibacillus lacus]GAX89738.1 3-dehydroquinate synthase [Effusibacillus lacus]
MSRKERRVRVDLADRSYDIAIGEGLTGRLGELALEAGVGTSSNCLVVTDDNVAKTGHLRRAVDSLQRSGYKVFEAIIPAGEESKNLRKAELLYDKAFEAGLDRKSAIFALGGGVVGDLAGFVAATYMRGIVFIQVPTTLLAHDSSVGGKVAVNHPKGKNVIGAFHQPKLVVYDISALNTLPEREIRSGLAEVIKHGLIWDADFYEWLESSTDRIKALDPQIMEDLLARSCSIKAAVVAQDEKENGLRAILNFGHTLGHAIESLSKYGTYTHGEAISIGMAFASEMSAEFGRINRDSVERICGLLERIGLPTEVPLDLDPKELLNSMKQDKKATGGNLTFVLLSEIGRVEVVKNIDEAKVLDLLCRLGRKSV